MVEPRTPIELYAKICEALVRVSKEKERLEDEYWEEQVAVWKKYPRLIRWIFRMKYPRRGEVDLEDTEYCWAACLLDVDYRRLEKLNEQVVDNLDQPLIQLDEPSWALIRLWTKLNKS